MKPTSKGAVWIGPTFDVTMRRWQERAIRLSAAEQAMVDYLLGPTETLERWWKRTDPEGLTDWGWLPGEDDDWGWLPHGDDNDDADK